MSPDDQLIVVIGGSFVAAIAFGDDQESVFVLFQIAVGKASGPTKLGAANFKPDEIVCVIDHAHLVGLSIAHAQECFVPLILKVLFFLIHHLNFI